MKSAILFFLIAFASTTPGRVSANENSGGGEEIATCTSYCKTIDSSNVPVLTLTWVESNCVATQVRATAFFGGLSQGRYAEIPLAANRPSSMSQNGTESVMHQLSYVEYNSAGSQRSITITGVKPAAIYEMQVSSNKCSPAVVATCPIEVCIND